MILRLPRIGMEMTEAVLTSWLVEDGCQVVAGQPLYVLETEKVEHEVEAPVPGVVHRMAVEGQTYQVGDEVAEILTS